MRNIAVIAALATMLMSCEGNKNPYINGKTITYDAKDVPTYTLSGEHMTHDVIAGRMSIADDYILFCSPLATDSIFTVYDLDITEPLASFGTVGQGPNDFLTLGQMKQSGIDNGDVYTWINDINTIKIKRLNISQSIKEGSAVVDKEIMTVPLAIECFIVTDSLFVIKKVDGSNFNIERYDPVTTDRLSSVPMYKTKIGSLYSVFASCDIYDKEGGRYISAMISANQINFTDPCTDNMYAVCVGKPTTKDEIWDEEEEDVTAEFYYDLCLTDKYLFALYINRSIKEEYPENPVEIHVFTKEGKLVAVLKTDEYFTQIEFDKYGRIYGADDNNNIYRYELPEELL